MEKNTYTLLNKFECCGRTMVTVIIDGKAACVMSKREYNRINGSLRSGIRGK